jgi:type IV secretory pathway VirB4 component
VRKTDFNAGIGLITQSAKHLENAGILDLVNEICPTKIPRAKPGDHAAYQRMVHLNEKEVELFSEPIQSASFSRRPRPAPKY